MSHQHEPENFEAMLEQAIAHIAHHAFHDEVERTRKEAFKRLSALLQDLARTADSGKPGAITEETDPDTRTVTVYPCPKCGNSDRDDSAAYLEQIRAHAITHGWDGMCPLAGWIGYRLAQDSRRRAENVELARVNFQLIGQVQELKNRLQEQTEPYQARPLTMNDIDRAMGDRP